LQKPTFFLGEVFLAEVLADVLAADVLAADALAADALADALAFEAAAFVLAEEVVPVTALRERFGLIKRSNTTRHTTCTDLLHCTSPGSSCTLLGCGGRFPPR
jgi:hypothetical protein